MSLFGGRSRSFSLSHAHARTRALARCRIDIGAGANTVRLDNVGLINGGTGVRMGSAANDPAGVAPGRPLFLIANDLEIDFPSGNAVELAAGEDVQLSNSYIQARVRHALRRARTQARTRARMRARPAGQVTRW